MKRRFPILILIILLLLLGVTQQKNLVAADRETSECTPVPEGLVYWLRAENNADDFTGDHNGTLYGDASYATGMVGNAFSFDGEENYVLIPSSEELPHGSEARTIEMWVYSIGDTWQRDQHTVYHKGVGIFHGSFGIDFDNYPTLQFYTWEDDLYVTTTLPETGWFHVAMVYDGSDLLSAYINGTLRDSVQLSAPLNTENTAEYIGAIIEQASYTYYFIGNIDEIAMYNRALSDTEILSIYNAGSYGKCANHKPLADAGEDQSVYPNSLVTLYGSLSDDPDGNFPLSYSWIQIDGEEVELNDSTICCPAFITPLNFEQLTFSLAVTDSLGSESDPDIVEIFMEFYKIFIPNILKN